MRRNPEEEGQRWLRQAQEELQDAQRLREAGRFYLSLFLCQQAAEKALKAYLYSKGEEPILSHSITELLAFASSYDTDFEKIARAKRLDDYYLPTRYPNSLPGGIPAEYYDDETEALEAERMAETVIALVKQKLTPESR
jgi:HEPN domain-containing protein